MDEAEKEYAEYAYSIHVTQLLPTRTLQSLHDLLRSMCQPGMACRTEHSLLPQGIFEAPSGQFERGDCVSDNPSSVQSAV